MPPDHPLPLQSAVIQGSGNPGPDHGSRPARPPLGPGHGVSRDAPRHHGRGDELGERADAGFGDQQCRGFRGDRLRLDGPGGAGGRDRGDCGADPRAVRRQPDHHASGAGGAYRCVSRGAGEPRGAGRRACRRVPRSGASRRVGPARSRSPRHCRSRIGWSGRASMRWWSRGRKPAGISGRFRSGCWRRRSCRRCDGGAGVRCGRHRAGGGDRRLSADGGGRGAARARASLPRPESIAHPRFKQAFVHARARDAQPSMQLDPGFPVIPVRALVNAATERFAQHQAEMIRLVAAAAS